MVISRESVQSFASFFSFVSVFRLFICGAHAEACVHLIGAGYLHGGAVAAVLGGDAYVPQPVGYFGEKDKYESLRAICPCKDKYLSGNICSHFFIIYPE